jgi:hypothetical protein
MPVERPDSRSGIPKSLTKVRRHQIPGLRQTPYLKVLFLRCDDNESYKAHARKEVRDWIKESTRPASDSKKATAQENHDAFEWLVVHVVVPNTAASTQPRTSSKGSSTTLEKLRADFNGSTKPAIDRVAQIRIGINDVPYDMLPRVVPAIPGSYAETPAENAAAWDDLIQKMKALILASFDMRVTQYEDDIREKDGQRSLPGWNFCTFFVLKEGLARGFESVGLVEDALVGYDELEVGLDAIVREQAAAGSAAEHGGEFLPYTDYLKGEYEKSLRGLHEEDGIPVEEAGAPISLQDGESGLDSEEIPLSATKKNYRELILSNNISIFDFRCYIFARQLSLLLRMANVSSSQQELLANLKEQRESSLQGLVTRPTPAQPKENAENLAILAQICRRTLEFITSIARIMREDLLTYESGRINKGNESGDGSAGEAAIEPLKLQIIDNIVSSFTFAVAQQILAQTSTKALPIPPSTLAPSNEAKIFIEGQEQKVAIPEPKTMMHPARTASLPVNTRPPVSPGIFPGGKMAEQMDAARTTFLKAGLEELAVRRAELYALCRNVLEQLGAIRHWSVGWNLIRDFQVHVGELEDVDLNGTSDPTGSASGKAEDTRPTTHGLGSRLLRTALESLDDFYRLYETLTDKALRHYTVANHMQSVSSQMVSLALLRFHLSDFAAAASFLNRITLFYGEDGWGSIEMVLLLLYTKCLKELKQNEEYVRVMLRLLSRGAATEKEKLRLKFNPIVIDMDNHVAVDGYLTELMGIISSVDRETSLSLPAFFADVVVDGNVRFIDRKDSFALQLKLNYLLPDDLEATKAKARMVPVAGGQGRDIWIETQEAVTLIKGVNKMEFHSNVIIPGSYVVKQIVLTAGKLTLSYDAETAPQQSLNAPKFLKCPRLLLYQRPDALDVKLLASRSLHLKQNRYLEVELSSGWNDLVSAELHIKSATPGLRLQTSEAKVVDGDTHALKKAEAGVMRFAALPNSSKLRVQIPFSLETEIHDITTKIEISYTTAEGTYFFANNPWISIMLPLGVNVQDVFKHKALFSKFTISSATGSPLVLLTSDLEKSEFFESKSGGQLREPVVIVPRQPASLLYKITPRDTPEFSSSSRPAPGKKDRASLSLVLHYMILEEEVENAVRTNLEGALVNTQFWQYSRLVVPAVLSQLHARMSPHQLENIALLSEVATSMISGVNWQAFFSGLEESAAVAKWVRDWIEATPIIPLLPTDTSEQTLSRSRSIVLPVEVPSVSVVHTADIKLPHGPCYTGQGVVVTAHEPIPASLHIRWTRMWDTSPPPVQRRQSQIANGEADPADNGIVFVYEVSAPADTWLLGGKRKGHFWIPHSKDAEQEEVLTFPLLIIPIKEGHLPFPHLEIRPAAQSISHGPTTSTTTASIDESGGDIGAVSCELDYRNSGETIHVVSNLKQVTVSLDAAGPGGGAWLLDSEKREADRGVVVV